MGRPDWHPSLLLRASALAHAGAGAGILIEPASWPTAIGALAANHVLLATAGLLPRNHLLGPNITRLPPEAALRGEVVISIDDGPDPEVTPQVLDQLDAAGAVASFFCIGQRAAAHPALVKEIVARGHRIENHTDHHWKRFSLLSPWKMSDEITRAQDILGALSGRAPRFFRPPAGLRNPFLDPILTRLDLRLATWTRRAYDTRVGAPRRVLERLGAGLTGGDILLLHDGNAARTASGRPVILEVLPPLLARIHAAGLHAVPL